MNSKIEKPWGYYIDLFRSPNCVQKTLVVKPDQSISLQYHKKREEFWVIVSGTGLMEIDGKADGSKWGLSLHGYQIEEGDSVYIGILKRHRITNIGEEDLVIAEIQFGECLEEDIIRIEDQYGRENEYKPSNNTSSQ